MPDTTQAAEATDWQPIDTAPKDGTLVIGYRGPARNPDIACMRWVSAEECADEDGGSPDDYIAGWSLADDPYSEQCPTHWMPLPRDPEATS